MLAPRMLNKEMMMKTAIKQMKKQYEQMLRNTNNISMQDVINRIIEDLNTLLEIAEVNK